MFRKHSILFLLVIGMLCACKPRSVEQAQRVVAEADSLWHAGRMYGVDAGDSATLAQAYETLKDRHSSLFSFVHGTSFRQTYAHACYHYGKLLRAKDDPEEAMRCFINATHSRTRDYHILGRVYSNMGSISHLAGEFQLSYDMYEKSADMFLQNGDTLAYYYGLNDMAFEKAMLADKEACLACLHTIEQNCSDRDVILKTMETKAELCLKHKQYDSAIICSNYLIEAGFDNTSVMLIKAQAYDDLSLPDSALLYAKMIMERSCVSPQERFNAIFIILHNDSTLDGDSINALASQREDIRYYDYEPEKEKLIYAVQLLRQKPQHKTSWMWLYAIAVIVLFMGSIFLWRFIVHKRKMISHVKQLKEKQTDSILLSIKQHIDTTDINRTLHWKNYALMKADADLYMGGIVRKLESYHLNETEIRLCILVLIGLNRLQIADTLPYASNSVGKLKDHTAKSLGTTGKNLRNFLLKMAIED